MYVYVYIYIYASPEAKISPTSAIKVKSLLLSSEYYVALWWMYIQLMPCTTLMFSSTFNVAKRQISSPLLPRNWMQAHPIRKRIQVPASHHAL